MIIFGELPGYYQLMGIIAALITIFLFYFSIKKFSSGSFKKKDYFYLLALLIGIGVNDFCFKIFQNWRPPGEKNFFILIIFSFAFLYSFSYVILKKIRVESKTIKAGLVLRSPEYSQLIFYA